MEYNKNIWNSESKLKQYIWLFEFVSTLIKIQNVIIIILFKTEYVVNLGFYF